jgi:hypothetical protein
MDALDGRCVIPKVPATRRPAHFASQYFPRRSRVCRVGRPVLGRRCGRRDERTRQVAHARARVAAESMWVALTQRYPRPSSSHKSPAHPPSPSFPEEEKHGDQSSLPKSSNPVNAAHTAQVQTIHSQAEEVIKLPPSSVDKSEALFSMYLDRADEDDKKITGRWKGECDAILIFVSHSYHPSSTTFVLTLVYRLVFSRLLLRPFLPFPSRAFSLVHRTPRYSISEIFIIYWPIPLPPSPSSFPSLLIHLNFLRRNPQSWSTHSGS